MKKKERGRATSATKVIQPLMDSIITSTPTRVVTAVIIWVKLWFRVVETVSTSLVIRLSTSPWVVLS